jgi:hypothetical protein
MTCTIEVTIDATDAEASAAFWQPDPHGTIFCLCPSRLSPNLDETNEDHGAS